MEMHQVRYFLAASRTLNFTRAAEQCNVAQPSLTRAIRQLESELGGDLFRRERPQAQLTELGQRMLPLLRQCYDSAVGARSLASSLKSGEVGALRLALSQGIDINLLLPFVAELGRHFRNLELKFLRGTALAWPHSSSEAMPNWPLRHLSAKSGNVSIAGLCSRNASDLSLPPGILSLAAVKSTCMRCATTGSWCAPIRAGRRTCRADAQPRHRPLARSRGRVGGAT